jgi:hypothetical protein
VDAKAIIAATKSLAEWTVGYYLLDASEVELSELQRGGYVLLRAVLTPPAA